LDKVGHFLAYAIMALWGLSAFRTRRASILVILFCLFLGVGLEFLQQLVSGRDPSVADGLANFIGIFVGIVSYFLWRRATDA
jgi:VanZ family protein